MITKVKVFYTNFSKTNEAESYERKINDWFAANPKISIIEIKQVASGRLDHHVTISIFYSELPS